MNILKKSLKYGIIALVIFVIGGVGGIVLDHRVVPVLVSDHPSLRRLPILRDIVEGVTVIEKTEQLVVREDDSVDAIVSQPSTAVVNVVAAPKSAEGSLARATEVVTRTGVLLTNDGLIATFGRDLLGRGDGSDMTFTALMNDGTSHEAALLAADPLTDLVFLKTDASGLPAIALANSDDSGPGTKLVAIGNSFEEYQNRFSIGVLSHRNKTFNLSGKTVASSEKWEGVIEMDLARPSEYVGGPAVNFRGEMVGMFGSLVYDGEKQVFLIPSNVVRETMTAVISSSLDRPMLGVYYLPLTKAVAIAYGNTRDRGALIYSPSGLTGLAVLSGSPADRAGLRAGDIIIAVNGDEVNLDLPLSVAIGRLEPGSVAELLVVRDGVERTVPVTLR